MKSKNLTNDEFLEKARIENIELTPFIDLLQSMKDRVSTGKPYSISKIEELTQFLNKKYMDKNEKTDTLISFTKDAHTFIGKLHKGHFPWIYNECDYVDDSNDVNISGEILPNQFTD
jgi:hypothetical protein